MTIIYFGQYILTYAYLVKKSIDNFFFFLLPNIYLRRPNIFFYLSPNIKIRRRHILCHQMYILGDNYKLCRHINMLGDEI